jgi:hypothetical protein
MITLTPCPAHIAISQARSPRPGWQDQGIPAPHVNAGAAEQGQPGDGTLRIDQQPAATSALVTKWVKPTNINCRETGLRSLMTNNCGHSRTKSEVSPKITFDGRLHVIAYRATLDVPREVV